jgi:flagellar biosynthesis protein FlhG
LTEERIAPKTLPEIVAVGGGKGGVGKTCFTVNAGIAIARRGWRVVLVDADLSCSNLETVLGVNPESRLDDYLLRGRAHRLSDVLCDTPYENLRLVPGTSGLLDVANPRYKQKVQFIQELRQLDADLVIVDLDAGAHLNTLDFFRMKDTQGIVVINPERTSIDNAFKFLRAALFRHIERFYGSPELGLLLKRNPSLDDLLATVGASPAFTEKARDQIRDEVMALARSFRPKIVVNKVRNGYEAKIAANILRKYCMHYLHVTPEDLGYVVFDSCVSESVNSGVPFISSRPHLKISGCIVDLANRLGFF